MAVTMSMLVSVTSLGAVTMFISGRVMSMFVSVTSLGAVTMLMAMFVDAVFEHARIGTMLVCFV
jgi:K+-transporting ATPase A subunit